MKYKYFLSTIKRHDAAFKRTKRGNGGRMIYVGERDEIAPGFNYPYAEFVFGRDGEMEWYAFYGGSCFEASEWLHSVLLEANNNMPLIVD